MLRLQLSVGGVREEAVKTEISAAYLFFATLVKTPVHCDIRAPTHTLEVCSGQLLCTQVGPESECFRSKNESIAKTRYAETPTAGGEG
jgi:hypothetical protein